MSTILYNEEKYLRVAAGLKNLQYDRGISLACAFKYPEGWKNEMDQFIEQFVQNLRDANIKAYQERYDEVVVIKGPLDFKKSITFSNKKICLLKSLCSIQYNIDNENVNGCAELLHSLIDALSMDIISDLPAWNESKGWD